MQLSTLTEIMDIRKGYRESLDEKHEHLKELRKKTGERIGEKVTGLKSGGPGSGRHPEGGRKLKDLIKQGEVSGRTFYHFTHERNVASILKSGIKANYPDYHVGQGSKGAYLFDPKRHSLPSSVEDLESRTFAGGRLLKVTLPDTFVLHTDNMMDGSVFSMDTIPSRFIEIWNPSRKSEMKAGGPGSGRHPYGGGKKFVKQEIKLPSGAKYTVLKPVTRGRPAGIKMKPGGGNVGRKHELAGKFSKFAEVKPLGVTNSKVAVFDAEKTPQWSSKAKEGEGSTVVVNRNFDTKKMTIKEYGRGEHGFINSGETRVAKFNNMGRGAAYLNKRFGITQKFKEK